MRTAMKQFLNSSRPCVRKRDRRRGPAVRNRQHFATNPEVPTVVMNLRRELLAEAVQNLSADSASSVRSRRKYRRREDREELRPRRRKAETERVTFTPCSAHAMEPTVVLRKWGAPCRGGLSTPRVPTADSAHHFLYGRNLPDKTSRTRSPLGSLSLSIFMLKSIALMMPSPKFSWITALSGIPYTCRIS